MLGGYFILPHPVHSRPLTAAVNFLLKSFCYPYEVVRTNFFAGIFVVFVILDRDSRKLWHHLAMEMGIL